MYDLRTHKELQYMVASGWYIRWALGDGEKCVRVLLTRNNDVMWARIPLSTMKSPPIVEEVARGEKNDDSKNVSRSWGENGWLAESRIASMWGILRGGDCRLGKGSAYIAAEDQHLMGYDFETYYNPAEGRALPTARIYCASVVCSCGEQRMWHTYDDMKSHPSVIRCDTNTELCDAMISFIADHRPDWLVGYNCYMFDNVVISANISSGMSKHVKSLYEPRRGQKRPYSFMLDIDGCYNVDVYRIIDKVHRSEYESVKLSVVAKRYGLNKSSVSTFHGTETSMNMCKYNLNDSEITMRLWHLSGSLMEVCNLSSVSKSPVIDCVRLVSGTMTNCMLSSFCMDRGLMIDWSRVAKMDGFIGGAVLVISKGLHKDLLVCDFSSMYPTIMRDLCVSPENINVIGSYKDWKHSTAGQSLSAAGESITWDSGISRLLFCVRSSVSTCEMKRGTVISDIQKWLMETRAANRKTDPFFAQSLKILSNSIYGSLAFSEGPLHSPRLASLVTLSGRVLLMLTAGVFKRCGLRPVYGDTDSCMVTSTLETMRKYGGCVKRHASVARSILQRILFYTPFVSMNLSWGESDHYLSGLFMDAKMYSLMRHDGTMDHKGVSVRRKDKLGICRVTVAKISEIVLSSRHDSLESKKVAVASLLSRTVAAVASGRLCVADISFEARGSDGSTCYIYQYRSQRQELSCSSTDASSVVPYDAGWVCTRLYGDTNGTLRSAGLGTAVSILECYGDI